MTMVKRLLLSLLTLVLLFSCEDKMDEHYKVPDWLKGSVWDVLSNNNEQYSIFQEGILEGHDNKSKTAKLFKMLIL